MIIGVREKVVGFQNRVDLLRIWKVVFTQKFEIFLDCIQITCADNNYMQSKPTHFLKYFCETKASKKIFVLSNMTWFSKRVSTNDTFLFVKNSFPKA